MRDKPNTDAAAIILLIVVVFLLAVIVYGLAVTQNEPAFSPHQPNKMMRDEYEACKKQAMEGFDCIMVPMLVSEGYIKETAADFK